MQENFPINNIEESEPEREREEKELAEIEKLTAQDKGDLRIVMPQELDSTDSSEWKKYLKREKLRNAWKPPAGSPFAKYEKTKTINSVEFVASRLKPRYSEGEQISEAETNNLIKSGKVGPDVAIILDSGGAHSIAIAVKLAQARAYQPIVMLDSIPIASGSVSSGQDLATLLFYASGIDGLKPQEKIKPDSPPVFVLDAHRGDKPILLGDIDNSHEFSENDFPSFEELKKAGFKKVIYLNELDYHGLITSDMTEEHLSEDLKPIFEKWRQQGLEIAYTGIEPWPGEVKDPDIPPDTEYPDYPAQDYPELEPDYFE